MGNLYIEKERCSHKKKRKKKDVTPIIIQKRKKKSIRPLLESEVNLGC